MITSNLTKILIFYFFAGSSKIACAHSDLPAGGLTHRHTHTYCTYIGEVEPHPKQGEITYRCTYVLTKGHYCIYHCSSSYLTRDGKTNSAGMDIRKLSMERHRFTKKGKGLHKDNLMYGHLSLAQGHTKWYAALLLSLESGSSAEWRKTLWKSGNALCRNM